MFRTVALCLVLSTPAIAIAAPMPASTYVKKAGASDKFEIDSSKMLMDSTNASIRDFAQKMVTDHTQSTADIKAAAMQAGMTVAPPMLDPMQKSNLAKLRAAHGTARDRLYVQQQKMSHQQALTLQQGYAADGTVEPLKMAAAKIVPVVQGHIDMLSSMSM